MAFYKVPSNIKTSILAFVKRIVNKRIYNAIEIILSPCCTIEITDVVYDCGTEDLTLTINPSQIFEASVESPVLVFTDGGNPPDNVFLGTGEVNSDGKSIVVGIPLADAPVGVDQIFTVKILMPTNLNNTNTGVYQTGVSAETTIVPC